MLKMKLNSAVLGRLPEDSFLGKAQDSIVLVPCHV